MIYNYALAIALIIMPDLDTDSPNLKSNAGVMEAVSNMALRMELLDPREAEYNFRNEEFFGANLKFVRERYQNLHDAPFDADHYRFPCKSICDEQLGFNRQYKQWLEAQVGPTRLAQFPEDINAAIEETENLYKIWDLARDSGCEYYYVCVRREALKNLRQIIGVKNFESGKLPPVVPLWRFNRMN